jgi:phosphoglycolate phosphatase
MVNRDESLLGRIRGLAIDLDGTLIDTLPDLATAANAALAARGHRTLPAAQLEGFIGNGIDRLVERALTASLGTRPHATELDLAVRAFRDAYARNLFERSRIYPGVIEGLRVLRSVGLRLCCMTNKAAEFAQPLLAQAGLAEHFEDCFSPATPAERKPNPALVLRACGLFEVEPTALLVVGDSRADVGAARAAGSRVAAVTYGYHQKRLVGDHAPDWFISSLVEVLALELPSAIAF